MSVPPDQWSSFGSPLADVLAGDEPTFNLGNNTANAIGAYGYNVGLLNGESGDQAALEGTTLGNTQSANVGTLPGVSGAGSGSGSSVWDTVNDTISNGITSAGNAISSAASSAASSIFPSWITNISLSQIVMVLIGILCIFAALFLFGFDQIGGSDTAKAAAKTVASNPELLA
jgi:hypothetical protein